MMSYSKLTLLRHAYATAVGTAAGATIGLVGWGGAQIIIPSMLYPSPLASYSQLSSTGISLSSLSLSSVSSGYRFWTDGKVILPIALAIGLPAAAAARFGTHLAKKMSGDALELFFNAGNLILFPSLFWIQERRVLSKARGQKNDDDNASQSNIYSAEDMRENALCPDESNSGDHVGNGLSTDATNSDKVSNDNNMMLNNSLLMQHATFGAFNGVLSALMGVGGLPQTISYLTLTTDLSHHEIQGTAVVALVPSMIMSAYSRRSSIPPSIAACVSVGGFGGGLAGAKLALGVSDELLQYFFLGSLCLFGGINMMGAARNIYRICSKKV